MTNLEKLKYIINNKNNESLLEWLENFVCVNWNDEDLLSDRISHIKLNQFLESEYPDNYDEGKGVWFIVNIADGSVYDSFIDPDIETLKTMYEKVQSLEKEFVLCRLSKDSLDSLYHRYFKD